MKHFQDSDYDYIFPEVIEFDDGGEIHQVDTDDVEIIPIYILDNGEETSNFDPFVGGSVQAFNLRTQVEGNGTVTSFIDISINGPSSGAGFYNENFDSYDHEDEISYDTEMWVSHDTMDLIQVNERDLD